MMEVRPQASPLVLKEEEKEARSQASQVEAPQAAQEER
jgi:hypothetical protein